MPVRLKPIKPNKKFLGDIGALEHAIESALDDTADFALDLHKKTTTTWDTKVNFYIRKTKFGRSIGTRSNIWKYVDQGTRPHVIQARRAPNLKFRAGGFRAKTRPNTITSSGGARGGNWVTKRSVRHPGTAARNFSEAIGKRAEKELAKALRKKFKGLFG